LRSITVKIITGSRKIVAPAATAGQSEPAHADDGRDEGRGGLRGARRQQHGKGVLVPSEDQAEDRRRSDAGGGLRQHDLVEGLEARVAVDQRRFLVLARNLVDEAL
jgi:hypothetical protein